MIRTLTANELPEDLIRAIGRQVAKDIASSNFELDELDRVETELDYNTKDGRHFDYEVTTDFCLRQEDGTFWTPSYGYFSELDYSGIITECDTDTGEPIAEMEFNKASLTLNIV